MVPFTYPGWPRQAHRDKAQRKNSRLAPVSSEHSTTSVLLAAVVDAFDKQACYACTSEKTNATGALNSCPGSPSVRTTFRAGFRIAWCCSTLTACAVVESSHSPRGHWRYRTAAVNHHERPSVAQRCGRRNAWNMQELAA